MYCLLENYRWCLNGKKQKLSVSLRDRTRVVSDCLLGSCGRLGRTMCVYLWEKGKNTVEYCPEDSIQNLFCKSVPDTNWTPLIGMGRPRNI